MVDLSKELGMNTTYSSARRKTAFIDFFTLYGYLVKIDRITNKKDYLNPNNLLAKEPL